MEIVQSNLIAYMKKILVIWIEDWTNYNIFLR